MIRRHLAALWLRWDLSRAVRRRRRTIRRLAREANRAARPCGASSGVFGYRCGRSYKHAGKHAALIGLTTTNGAETGRTTTTWGDGSTEEALIALRYGEPPHVPRHDGSFPRPMSHHTRSDR